MVTADPRFGAEIRGRGALRRWLQKLRPGGDPNRPAYDVLTPRQQTELLWDLPCALCGSRPVGLVKHSGTGVEEFRCPTGECGARPYVRPPRPESETAAATQEQTRTVPLTRR
jgi:hypothetical protein